MKLLISAGLTALASFAVGLFFPWWSLTIAAFLVAFFSKTTSLESFLAGFLGVFLLWSIMAWSISSSNDHILAHRMSQVIIKNDSPFLLVLLTGLAGGMSSGFAAWCGTSFRHLFKED